MRPCHSSAAHHGVRGCGRGTTSQGDRWVLTGYSHAYSYAQGTHVRAHMGMGTHMRAHMGMGTHMRTHVGTHTCRGGALARLLPCRAGSVAWLRRGAKGVLTCVLTRAAAEHVRLCCVAVRAALRWAGRATEGVLTRVFTGVLTVVLRGTVGDWRYSPGYSQGF